MGKELELINAYEKEEKEEVLRILNRNDRLFRISATLMPIFFLLFIMYLNESTIINKRMGVFFLLLFITSLLFNLWHLWTLKRYNKLKLSEKKKDILIFNTLCFLLIFLLFKKNSSLKKYIISETEYIPKYHVVVSWFYGTGVYK